MYFANVSSIDSYAFSSCTSLAQITLSDTINIKGEHAFDCAGLTNINLKNISIVREHAFANCSSLRSVDFFSSGITELPDFIFKNCTSLDNVSIPSTANMIKDGAIEGYTQLKKIFISVSVTYIGYDQSLYAVFTGCTSLSDVYYSETSDQWNSITIACDYDKEILSSDKIHFNSTHIE